MAVGWITTTEEEGRAEYEKYFGKFDPAQATPVCEDCYRKIDLANNPHMVEEVVREMNKLE